MHRQKAASLERALEAVLKECDDLVKAADAAGARDAAEVSATGEDEGCPGSTAAAAAAAPSMLLGVDSPAGGSDASPSLLLLGEGDSSQQETGEATERSLLNFDGSDRKEEAQPASPSSSAGEGAPACGEPEPTGGTEGEESSGSEEGSSCGEDDEGSVEEAQLDSSSEQSADEPSMLLGVDDINDAADGDSGNGDGASAPSLLLGVDDPDASGSVEASATATPSLLLGVDDPDASGSVEASAAAPSLLSGVDDHALQPEPRADEGDAAGAESSLLEFGEKTADRDSTTAAAATGTGGSDGAEDGGEAAVVERLAAWLSGLKIRETDASRYAGRLVADGFDSEEVCTWVSRGLRCTEP